MALLLSTQQQTQYPHRDAQRVLRSPRQEQRRNVLKDLLVGIFRPDLVEPKLVTLGGVYITSGQTEWTPSDLPCHHRGSPLIARRTDDDSDDTSALARSLKKSRTLPRTSPYLESNHLMINDERIRGAMQTLQRCAALDDLAQRHATSMAESGELHLIPTQDFAHLQRTRIGMNVSSATSATIRELHNTMVRDSTADRNNCLDRRFAHMGVGTAIKNETVYLCQIFSS